jgi:predicted enzyme related to lactoylglutathione lyase
VFADTDGAVFNVWQANQHKGARVVNEHGSLNFNGLHTRDLAGAKEFYGKVFGWTTLAMGGGAEMWTLPGYGDYLEALNPGLRQGMADMGAAGFEDVVAAITPVTDDTPPHWDVTFAVDDADATAAKAAELGGRVIAPPFDAPWVRMAVIADPQGATFIASQFVQDNSGIAQPDAAATAS